MKQKVIGEAPFQVLATNFSIGPSNEGYTLQISADGRNYSDLFSVGANVTRMVTGVANGSYYRLSGNNSEVVVNWQTQCNDGGSGGGEGTGPQGPMGPQGNIGPIGPQGPQGPAGEGSQGGDSHILMASSGIPETIEDGDVYAIHRDATDVDYGTNWVDTTEQTTYWGDSVADGKQAIRIANSQYEGTKFNFGFNCSAWGTVESVTIDRGGNLEMNGFTFKKLADNHWVFNDSNWEPYVNGAKLYVDYDGTYIYVYSTNKNAISITQVNDNYTGNNVYTGTVTPAMGASNDVYQYTSRTANVIEVFGEGVYDNNIESEDQFVVHEGGKMGVRINDIDAFAEYAIEEGDNGKWQLFSYESWGDFGPVYFDGNDKCWEFYDDKGVLITDVSDGDEGNFTEFDNNALYFSYHNGVLYLWTGGDKGFQQWDFPDLEVDVVESERLAKASEVPDSGRLLPATGSDGDVPVYDGWNNRWATTNRPAIVTDGMYSAYQYSEPQDGTPMALVRTDYWGIGWQPTFKMVKMTQSAYDDLQEKDPNTLYLIIEVIE